jgi:hypothetical protein
VLSKSARERLRALIALKIALVENSYSGREERIIYFDLGLAGRQSLFLVEDLLRDDQ